MSHAAGPWSVDTFRDGLWIVDGTGNTAVAKVMHGRPDARANAERIVQCVNAHDELAALLQETLRPGAYGIGSTLAARIEAALAKAGVQP